jgi:MFS transporter, ACS family, allantoate permease
MSTKHDEEKLEELDLTQTRTIDLEQEKKLASSADDALAFAVESGRITWTPEEERKLLWKIDLRLLPLMLIASLLAYTDAQAYGMAAIFGLIQDLKLFVATISDGKIVLDLTKYQWSNSITNCGSMFVSTSFPDTSIVSVLVQC